MIKFSNMLDQADEDVEVYMGTSSTSDDSLIADNQEVTELSEHLDDVSERNNVTIELMRDTEVATESRELTSKEYLILQRSMEALSKTKTIKTPVMESGETQGSRFIALEGFKETLKRFWEYIKDMLLRFWNMLKRWWYKTFDISKRTISRAKKIRSRADKEFGYSAETDMSFSAIGKLAINGKCNNPGEIVAGLVSLENIVKEYIDGQSNRDFDNSIDNVSNSVNDIITDFNASVKESAEDENLDIDKVNFNLDKTRALLKHVGDLFASNNSRLVDKTDFTFANSEKYVKQHSIITGDKNPNTLKHSEQLPGDKWVLSNQSTLLSSGGNGDELPTPHEVIEYLRGTRLSIAESRYNPKIYDGTSVKILQPNIISRGCEHIISICTDVNEYKQCFEKRDRLKDRVVKEVDNIVKDMEDEEDNPRFRGANRVIRSFANSVTSLIRRRSDFETSLCAYAVGTSVTFLDYADKSLKQLHG